MSLVIHEGIERASGALDSKITEGKEKQIDVTYAEIAKCGHVARYIRDQKLDQLLGEVQLMIEQGKSKEEIEAFLKEKAKAPEGDISGLKNAKNVGDLKAFMGANGELTEKYFISRAADFLLNGGKLSAAGSEINLGEILNTQGADRLTAFQGFRTKVQNEVKIAETAIIADYARVDRQLASALGSQPNPAPQRTPTIDMLSEVKTALKLPEGASLVEVNLPNGTKIDNFTEENLKIIKQAIENKQNFQVKYKVGDQEHSGTWTGEAVANLTSFRPVILPSAPFDQWLAMSS